MWRSLLVVSILGGGTKIEFHDSVEISPDPFVPLLTIPRFLEDPQTVPIFDQRFFIFGTQGDLCIDVTARKKNVTHGHPDSSDGFGDSVDDVFILALTQHQWSQAKSTIVPDGTTIRAHPNLPSTLRLPVGNGIHSCWQVENLPYVQYQPLFVLLVNPNLRTIALNGTITLRNQDQMQQWSHLSLTQYAEQRVAIWGSVAFGCLALVFSVKAFRRWCYRHASRKIEYLLILNCLIKSFYLGFTVFNYYTFHDTGTAPLWQRFLPRVLSKLQDVYTLMLLLGISLGLFVFRTRMSQIEWRFCAGVALLSTYLAIFEVSIGGFQVSRYILAAVVYLCIVICVNFSVAAFSLAVNESSFEAAAITSAYQLLQSYQRFRIIFVFYIIKPSSLLLFSLAVVGEQDVLGLYLLTVFDLAADFAILALLLYTFQPSVFKILSYVTKSQIVEVGDAVLTQAHDEISRALII